MVPDDLRFTDSHEWVRVEGNIATVGITDYAQEQLTDIVYVELPDVGRSVGKKEECGVIESCKIAADLYAPVSGTVKEVNEELGDHPEYINQDPFGKGWIIILELSDPSELDSLMNPAAYKEFLEKES